MDKPNQDNPTSFHADTDVFVMLNKARARGIKLRHLCNEALRAYLTKLGFKKGSK